MNVILVGAGAQAKYAQEIYRHYPDRKVIGMIDVMDNPDYWGRVIDRATVLGNLSVLESLIAQGQVDAALICTGNTAQKEQLWQWVRRLGLEMINAIHPQAVIASTAELGTGVIVNACAVIQPFARIGHGVMIHAGAIVEHDSVVGDFANLAPGSRLAGWVHVGKRATIFTGASIIPQITIGDDAVVGAGTVVIRDVAAETTVVGVPARVVNRAGIAR